MITSILTGKGTNYSMNKVLLQIAFFVMIQATFAYIYSLIMHFEIKKSINYILVDLRMLKVYATG